MGSLRFGGIRFVVYSNDHLPRHIHAFLGGTEVIIDLHEDGDVDWHNAEMPSGPAEQVVQLYEGRLRQRQITSRSWLRCGRGFMAKHKVLTTDGAIDRARLAARELSAEPRVQAAHYYARLDLIALELREGRRVFVPREDVEGLAGANKRQVAEIEVLGSGTGLHWPALDLDLYVPALLNGVLGSRKWLQAIGSKGGSAATAAKVQAARTNGALGGRPRKTAGPQRSSRAASGRLAKGQRSA